MDTEILIAIIGVISSIGVSLISLITALLVAKRSGKANQDLERLRLDQEQVRLLLGININTFKESLEAVEEACTIIQRCRDEIQIILPKLPVGLKQKDSKPFQEACSEFISFYSKKYFLFSPEYRMSLHELKNETRKVREFFQTAKMVSKDDYQVVSDLSRFLSDLTKIQIELLTFRDKMLSTSAPSKKSKVG